MEALEQEQRTIVWEYHARDLSKTFGPKLEKKFNELGQEGWEFVAVAKKNYAIFKRRKH